MPNYYTQPEETVVKAIELLLSQGYLIRSDDKLITTDKGNAALQHVNKEVKAKLNITPMSVKERYRKFIKDAKVPRFIQNGTNRILASAISGAAEKVFNAITSNKKVEYDVLIKATEWYYADTTMYRKIISNYLLEGDWEVAVEHYKERKQEGKSDKDTPKRNVTTI